jgi:RNA 2',3'-cyclic 3'-phosphodiesterase
MRLFFAVELPHEVQNALGKLRPHAEPWARDYRWVEPASMHITLAFLGEQPEPALASLQQIGAAAASTSQPGTLSIGSPGSFGPRRAPRVLWVGLEGDVAKLQQLQANLANGLKQHAFPVEERAFSPHITLARRRDRADSGLPPVWPPAAQPKAVKPPLEQLTLFESQLSRAGAHYTAVMRFALTSQH